MAERMSCATVADTLAEVATGAASGPDRARVLSHLAGCEKCRRELDELTRVADEVLLVAPEHEPPAGFESAVLARIAEQADRPEDDQAPASASAPTQVPHPLPAERRGLRRAFRPLALAAAAVVIALGSAGVVWQATSDERDIAASYRDTLEIANGQYFAAAPLLDPAGNQVGHVFLYQGEPAWVFAVLGQAAQPGVYDVVVATDDARHAAGTCDAENGDCGAGATVDADIRDIRYVQLVAEDGPTFTASLSSGWGS
ncbi:anti-sigma factor family protein [Phytoactinopolyspora halotolerans]|uniref:Putative zinc-finger domain-containing protein n=1 Tax=Phytoactinopolyspora halotolerans TaxID=1981512 RepID=A0A6L9SIG0_9ACTN|nr:zf-HC2 domain-containing protein [Phytoactinopolyspora halotolerans]NEE04468.1 hypothetical protein [Phytoactinopolyspora halotolerans]